MFLPSPSIGRGDGGEGKLTAKRWDAEHYNESFSFIWQYGSGLLELLDVKPGERVLDLGCGTGHLTAEIAERGATVVGIDYSAEMIAAARESYPEIEFHQMDATDFAFNEPFDAVFSNAVLHWARPPGAVARCISTALKPGGRLVAELGGRGNVEQVVTALVTELERHGHPEASSRNPWYFPSIAEYTSLLEEQGMEPVYARLFDRLTPLNGGEDRLAGWLAMFGDPFLSGVPDETQQAVIEAVVDRLRPTLFHDGTWHPDYRRLQVVATT